MRVPPDYERHLLDLARERGVEPVPIRAPAPPASEPKKERPVGLAQGDWTVSDRFFDPLPPDMLAAFEGKASGRPRPGVMNRTEQAYADHLGSLVRAGELRRWAFEAVKFRLGPKCYYTPDFLVVFAGGRLEMHEIKGGFIREDAQIKMKWFVREFPEFPLVVVRRVGGGWTYERRDG